MDAIKFMQTAKFLNVILNHVKSARGLVSEKVYLIKFLQTAVSQNSISGDQTLTRPWAVLYKWVVAGITI